MGMRYNVMFFTPDNEQVHIFAELLEAAEEYYIFREVLPGDQRRHGRPPVVRKDHLIATTPSR
jgi:hypothetical protein